MSIVTVEFIKAIPGENYSPGDRTTRTEKEAKSLVKQKVARVVSEEEIAARKDTGVVPKTPLKSYVELQVPFEGKYNGDRTWMDEDRAKELADMNVVKVISTAHPEGASKAEDKAREEAERAAETRESRAEQLPEEYPDLLNDAKAVAERLGIDLVEEYGDRRGNTCKEFLLDHWADYLATKV